MLQQFANESARPRSRVKNFDASVDKVLAEVFFAKPVGAFDHEAHDFVGRIDHAQPIGGLGIIDLVKILVDDLEKGLLFRMRGNLRGGRADGGVIGLKLLERLPLGAAGEEFLLQRVKLSISAEI